MASQTAVLDLIACSAEWLFCGAALYISAVEVPGRAQLPPREAVQWFRQSFPRAAKLQPAFLITGTLASVLRYFSSSPAALSASLQQALLVNVATNLFLLFWTRTMIIPGANELMKATNQRTDAQSSQLLRQWGSRHAVRTLLSAVAATGLLAVRFGQQ